MKTARASVSPARFRSPGMAGWARMVATDLNNFAPRVGIAYSPTPADDRAPRLANSPHPGASAVNAGRPIPTLAVSRESAEHSTSSWSTISGEVSP
jgi:hypothetical protein